VNRVSELRRAKGWSQVKLAGASEVSLGTIQTIESGEANPTLDTLRKLAVALGVDVRELLGAVA
jgi:transcriptional regulator with XRE-family HTH domain